jgi:hypothetical protein
MIEKSCTLDLDPVLLLHLLLPVSEHVQRSQTESVKLDEHERIDIVHWELCHRDALILGGSETTWGDLIQVV